MFNSKLKAEIANLKWKLEITEHNYEAVKSGRNLLQIKNDEAQTKLMMDIREMDQLVYNMGQCSSWDQMRPYFQQLQDLCSRRQLAESNRVRDLLMPEIKKVYLQPSRRRIGDT